MNIEGGMFLGNFTYVDLFSGVGGFRQALDKLGGKCVMASEIDKWANIAYETLYGHKTVGDITKVKAADVPDHDLLVAGFPCQAFSIAGKRLGFEDTRGTLFFEVARIASEKQPNALLLENVKGLVSHDKGKTLNTIIQTLCDIGYTIDFNVLNSKYFGVPQNRERIFIIAIRDDLINPEPWKIEGTNVVAKAKRRIAQLDGVKTFNFDWPPQTEVTTKLRDILEDNVDERFYLSEEKTAKLVAQLRDKELKILENRKDDEINPIYTPDMVTKNQNGRRIKPGDDVMPALTVQDRHGVVEPVMLGHIDIKGHDATTIGGGHCEPKIAEEQLKKGGIDVSEKERNTIEILRNLRKEIGEETFAEWRFRVLDSLQSSEILRQKLYGEIIQRAEDNGRSKLVHSAQMGERDKESGNVRDMWLDEERRNTSQGRELEEQFARELASVMSELSYQNASAEKILQDMRETTKGSRLLQQALHQIQEIWRPSIQEKRYRIRKLTPRETFRLQGFPDSEFDKLVAAGISNSQLYKKAGNAVTVNVVEAVAKRLIPMLTEK
jgi:DNA (cytosine-5)-methyltransferase 1